MTKWSNYYPPLVYAVFGVAIVYSMAPFVAKWVLILGVFVLILGGMFIAGTRFDLEA